MSKRGVNSAKLVSEKKTSVVRGTVPIEQKKIIESLVGVLGSNEQDVVGNIITLWIYNEGFLKNKIVEKSEGRSL